MKNYITIQCDTISQQAGFVQKVPIASNWYNSETISKIVRNIYPAKFGSNNCYVTVIDRAGDKTSFQYKEEPAEVAEEVADYIINITGLKA